MPELTRPENRQHIMPTYLCMLKARKSLLDRVVVMAMTVVDM